MKGLVEFARDHLGVELWPGQVDVLPQWEQSGRRRAVLRLGRRSGKDLMGAAAAIHNAVVPDYSRHLRPGEQRFIVVVATREQQAREFVRVVRELLEAAPDQDLRELVSSRAAWSRVRLPWSDSPSAADEVVFRPAWSSSTRPPTCRRRVRASPSSGASGAPWSPARASSGTWGTC